MAYVRWSHDSDVYAYQDVYGGFTLHIAGGRWTFAEGKEPPNISDYLPDGDFTEYVEKRRTAFENGAVVDMPDGMKHAGKTYNFATLSELLWFLEDLEQKGYMVPDYAFKSIKEEIEETDNG